MPVRTLATDKDAYVDAGSPDSNFGDALALFVRWQSSISGGNHRDTLVGFDLAPIFDDADVLAITAATLRISPTDADAGESLDAHEITPNDWTEDAVTWNTKPTAGSLQDTESSTNDPHEWDVLTALEAAFEDAGKNRVGFLLGMQEGLAGETNAVEYDSREATGSQDAELELETHEQRRESLDSLIEVSNSGTGELDAFVEVKFFHDRWLGGRQDALQDGAGAAYTLGDIAWDPTLDQLWTTEAFAGAIVHRHKRDGTHDQTVEIHEDGAPLSEDVQCVAVDDAGNVFLGLADASATVVECTLDEANDVLDVQQRNTAHELTPSWITFDGTRVWLLEFLNGEVEERHPSNWALNRSGSVGGGDRYRGIARADDHDEMVLWDDASGELEVQDPDDLGTVQSTLDRDAIVATGEGLAFQDRSWYGALFAGDSGDTGSEVWTFAAREITASLLVPTPEQADLATQVQPGSIPATADVDSQVATGNKANLSASLTPRVPAESDLASLVQPAGLAGSGDLRAIVAVASVPIEDDALARAEGRVSPQIVVDEADMADVSGEVGAAITLDPDGEARDLRRVVQLLDTEERYPQERADPATVLHRGDAILYAQQTDDFSIGDTIAWQGRDWTVIGLLGWEMVGDSRLYQEIGLRRVVTVHEARATGTVA